MAETDNQPNVIEQFAYEVGEEFDTVDSRLATLETQETILSTDSSRYETLISLVEGVSDSLQNSNNNAQSGNQFSFSTSRILELSVRQLQGLQKHDGGIIQTIDHLIQSINDILTTPLGSRLMRREYGSLLFELIDKPQTPETIMSIYSATAEALEKDEPRIDLLRVQIQTHNQQQGILYLSLEWKIAKRYEWMLIGVNDLKFETIVELQKWV